MPHSVQLLHKIPLFSQASPSSMAKIAQLTENHFYKKGTLLFNSLEAPSTFLFVQRGWVKLSTESLDGTEVIVDILTDGHYCGDHFIFEKNNTPSQPYSALAISDVQVFTLPIQELKNLLLSDHQLSLNFLQATLNKLQAVHHTVEHLSIQNASQRIGCLLLKFCNPSQLKSMTLHLPYDKALLALRLGMQPETFSRALYKLSEQCHIKIENNRIHIQDVQKLSDFVCQHCSSCYPECKKISPHF